MPKLTISKPIALPTVTTALNDSVGTVVGERYSESYTSLNRVVTVEGIKKAWSSFSKNEKEQALLFLYSNSDKVWKQKLYKCWFITTYKNLSSGRTIKTIGCATDGSGLPVNQLKSVLGVK